MRRPDPVRGTYSIVTGISVVNDSYADDSGSRTRIIAGPGFEERVVHAREGAAPVALVADEDLEVGRLASLELPAHPVLEVERPLGAEQEDRRLLRRRAEGRALLAGRAVRPGELRAARPLQLVVEGPLRTLDHEVLVDDLGAGLLEVPDREDAARAPLEPLVPRREVAVGVTVEVEDVVARPLLRALVEHGPDARLALHAEEEEAVERLLGHELGELLDGAIDLLEVEGLRLPVEAAQRVEAARGPPAPLLFLRRGKHGEHEQERESSHGADLPAPSYPDEGLLGARAVTTPRRGAGARS
jgi:hypothetical protein